MLSNTSKGSEKDKSIRKGIEAAGGEKEMTAIVLEAFITFLATLLGFPASTSIESSPLAQYGLDSLSAVGCQYWLHRGMPYLSWFCYHS